MADCVQIGCRVRPFNQRERDRNARLIVAMAGTSTVITDPDTAATKTYTLDKSYWSHDGFEQREDGYLAPTGSRFADQRKVFDGIGKQLLENLIEGFNSSVLAYGQTGTGKSYTIFGQGANRGLLPLTCDSLFKYIRDKSNAKLVRTARARPTCRPARPARRRPAPSGCPPSPRHPARWLTALLAQEFRVRLQVMEVYNERVRDLLNQDAPARGLKVRQHPKLGVLVAGLSEVAVRNGDDLGARIEEAVSRRCAILDAPPSALAATCPRVL